MDSCAEKLREILPWWPENIQTRYTDAGSSGVSRMLVVLMPYQAKPTASLDFIKLNR